MCGIVGFTKHPDCYIIDKEKLLNSIVHRGPDEQNYFENDSIFLGHTRLSIVDLEGGQQPYFYEHYAIIFNGEIYNFKQVRDKLGNFTFETGSDTEVLLKAYIQFGASFVEHLNGMFAFAIYNLKENSLVIGRDYFGIKPLYYYKTQDSFYFSSEMQGLAIALKDQGIELNLNIEAQKKYLSLGAINELSIIDNIKEFERGTVSLIEKDKITVLHQISSTSQNEKGNLEFHLNAEVEEQMQADVPVGVLLSGGIDSSLLTAIASRVSSPLKTFSVVFDGEKKYDEGEYARLVSKKFGTQHHEYNFSEDVAIEYIDLLVDALDTPICDPAMLPMLFLCQQTSKHVKVVLSGDGGDELFAGYTHHRIKKYRKTFETIATTFSKIPGLSRYSGIIYKQTRNSLSFQEQLEYDLEYGLNYRLLRKTDICSMRFGLEVRVPFLSRRIYTKATSKNLSNYVNLFMGKIPLRKLVAKLVNKKIAYKKKAGFRVPIKEWITTGKLGAIILHDLTHDLKICSEVVAPDVVKYYTRAPEKYYNELFSIYLLNRWINKVNNL